MDCILIKRVPDESILAPGFRRGGREFLIHRSTVSNLSPRFSTAGGSPFTRINPSIAAASRPTVNNRKTVSGDRGASMLVTCPRVTVE